MQYYTLEYTGFDKFYAMFDAVEPWNLQEDSYLCPECNRILIWKKWAKPRCVKLSKALFGDMVFSTASVDGVLVSQRFKDLYEKSDLKGITAFHKLDKVSVSRNPKKLAPPSYYYIETAMANAVYDPDKTTCLPSKNCTSRKNLSITKDGVKKCSLCNPYNYDGIPEIKGFGIKYLDNNLLDIFCFYPRPKYEHFSQKFVDWVLKNNITNFKGKIIPTEKYIFAIEDGLTEKTKQELISRLKSGQEY